MDLSSTHNRRPGGFWVPKDEAESESTKPSPSAAAPPDFTNLDITALHARLTHLLGLATSRTGSPTLTADERQFWAGAHHGLLSALRLFEPTRPTSTPARPHGEPAPPTSPPAAAPDNP